MLNAQDLSQKIIKDIGPLDPRNLPTTVEICQTAAERLIKEGLDDSHMDLIKEAFALVFVHYLQIPIEEARQDCNRIFLQSAEELKQAFGTH